jgi:deoxyribodipyrimidine photo-lyase
MSASSAGGGIKRSSRGRDTGEVPGFQVTRTPSRTVHLHWHRRDLRTADNRTLAAAAEHVTIPVCVFDPDVLAHGSPPRVAFMLDALAALRERYRDGGSDLLLAEGDPADVLSELATEHGADVVTWARDYSGLARERDERVRKALEESGIECEPVHDAVLHEPGTITTNDGDPYAVFSYFEDKWHDRPKADPVKEPDADALHDADGLDTGSLPSPSDLDFEEPEADIPPAGTEAARDLLDAFVDDDIFRYADRRDFPADGCTSRLSPHLKWGTIGVREVYAATAQAMATARSDAERESVREFQSQLAWREFYTQVLRYNPSVVTENYRQYDREIEWRDDPEELRAWTDGETGYPIVDAGMRQLRSEAFVHNRVRMIVASFLTKDLLVNWRRGYDWFRRKLVDHDTANDNGGWQWAASTGTDAQPYFRIFNPVTQGERHDPDAEYITEYVPELRDATPEQIHNWTEFDDAERERIAPDYPAPIVDHAERREAALAMFRRARGEDEEE